MNKRIFSLTALCLVLLWLINPSQAFSTSPNLPNASLGRGFTYQGFLTNISGAPIHDTCEMWFSLYDASSGGSPIGSFDIFSAVSVEHGHFSVLLNEGYEFGSQPFDNSQARWLQIWVRCTGETSFTMLSPRQRITWTPPTHDHHGQIWSGASTIGLEITGSGMGLYGKTHSTSGAAVYGYASSSTGETRGVIGYSHSSEGIGVRGISDSSIGTTYGVAGVHASNSGFGVYGLTYNSNGFTSGVRGESWSTDGRGVLGWAMATTGSGVGVYGLTQSASGYAGKFDGPVYILGPLTKPGGSFQIDHPLDPENQFLNHSFVESPEMKNVYDGVETLDANGEAWVELPKWFEALNKDFRYQLTPIGGSMPDLYIAHEIQGNRFKIAGGQPGMRVSWLVTGVRHDPWAEANRIPVEEPKPPEQQGYYLYPELYGQPAEMGIDYMPPPEVSTPTPELPGLTE